MYSRPVLKAKELVIDSIFSKELDFSDSEG
jgi:hypothetical protein